MLNTLLSIKADSGFYLWVVQADAKQSGKETEPMDLRDIGH